jgi:mono/diheme cytochrome c family protein
MRRRAALLRGAPAGLGRGLAFGGALSLALGVAACGAGRHASPPTPEPVAEASASTSRAPLDGAALLQRTCTVCHSLRGLPAYANYWGEPEWRSMVETMVGYGAVLAPEEFPVLVRYLAVTYGTAGKTTGSSRD